MCNIAADWDSRSKILGLAWVVRNDRGVVLLHSRSSMAGVRNKEEANLKAILWAVESMSSLRLNKIIFAGQFEKEFGALAGLNEVQLLVITRGANRGASFIAQSVIRENRQHSYVAAGPPQWLFEVFVNESRGL